MLENHGMQCFCCHGARGVSEMTDGVTSHTVCDDCRTMVTMFFHIHRALAVAVLEVARAKRGRVLDNEPSVGLS